MNTLNSTHVNRALLTLQAWQADAKARNLPYYTEALIHNELSVIPGNEYTTHKSCCDCCCRIQEAGIRKFKRQHGSSSGDTFEYHFCEECWKEIVDGRPIPVEIPQIQLQRIE